ncbi:MAG: ATP-binding protein [Desulfonatronovibrio sp.]
MSLDCQQTSSRLECCFPAQVSFVDEVLSRVSTFLAGRCSERTFFYLSLVLREALNNAVFHGAKQNSACFINFSGSLSQEKVSFEVQSPGPGFNWRKRLEKNPVGSTSQCGWGMFIISRYSDGFEYNESGNILKFWMNISETN